jgi:hypothetical protein
MKGLDAFLDKIMAVNDGDSTESLCFGFWMIGLFEEMEP